MCSKPASAAVGTQCSVLCLRCDQRWLIYGLCKSALNDSPTIGCSLAACSAHTSMWFSLHCRAVLDRAGQYSALQGQAVQCTAGPGSTVHCRAGLYSALQGRAVQCTAGPGSAVPCSAIHCNAVGYLTGLKSAAVRWQPDVTQSWGTESSARLQQQRKVQCTVQNTTVQ